MKISVLLVVALSAVLFSSPAVLAEEAVLSQGTVPAQERGESRKFAIAIHGGCGDVSRQLSDEIKQEYLSSLRRAVLEGRQLLADGRPALDVVEIVAMRLEDDPRFNAGKGAIFNREGHHELDASIMDGQTLSCAGVAGLTTTKNPIAVARLVMDETDQVLLAGEGANRFSRQMNLTQVAADYFYTPRLRELWQGVQSGEISKLSRLPVGIGRGTIGVVALDTDGNLAAATSTGGRFLKPIGRIGDSPIIGAGTYAKNGFCAVSCTGTGEEFIRHSIARTIAARMEFASVTLAEAAHREIHSTLQPGMGGCIAIGADGTIVMDYNTKAMLRAAADSSGKLIVKMWE